MEKVRVRFAPSPTGIPHIGGTRTALFNYLFAKANRGDFILRIEDTDQKRLVKGSEEALLEILKWLDIEPSGEIVRQSQRLDIYNKHAHQLLDKKLAYEKDGAVWVNVSDNKSFGWVDLVGNKKISFAGKDIEDFVILKSDGFPTYHLANVVDDHLMQITHVLRGEEWISSTPKHLYLYEILEWNPPKFAHLPVILGPDKTKLSKRHGAKSVLDYRDEGYLKEALLNYMALLGWRASEKRTEKKTPHVFPEREILELEFMISFFRIEDVNTSNPIFDSKKLEWMNGAWVRKIAENDIKNQKENLKNRLMEFYNEDKDVLNLIKGSNSELIIKTASSRMKTLRDFKELISTKTPRKKTTEEKNIADKLLKYLEKGLGGGEWEDEKFLAALKNFSKNSNVPFKKIYFILTKKEQGIGLLELNQIYGKEFFIKNLKDA